MRGPQKAHVHYENLHDFQEKFLQQNKFGL